MANLTNISLTSTYGGKTSTSTLGYSEWNNLMNALQTKINEIIAAENSNNSSTSTGITENTILDKLKFNANGTTYVVTMNDSGEFVITLESTTGTTATDEGLTSDSTQFYSGDTTYSGTDDRADRGAAALYSLGSTNIGTTSAKNIANVSIVTSKPDNDKLNQYTELSNGSYIKMTLLGDRVRFGSWYIPKVGQTTFNCSHDYIEIVNSGTFDFPLSNTVLGIIYRNNVEPSATTLNATHFGIKEVSLTGAVRAGSSYIIRGKSHNLTSANVLIDNYDISLEVDPSNSFDFSSTRAYGLLLYNSDLSKVILKGGVLQQLQGTTTNSDKFVCQIDKRVIDIVMLGTTTENGYFVTAGETGSRLFTSSANATYTIQEDSIVKDLYELDPAKQGFRSLTSTVESSNARLDKVQQETIPLGNKTLQFPHSNQVKDVSSYAPKASNQLKNILTDKTKPDFKKPNMVTCSFGINAATTRCFNWISMGDEADEYVWIKKSSDATWTKIESYKTTTSDITESTGALHRVEFKKEINNIVYSRIHNVFPGDSTYTYTAHKCIVYILDAISTGDPVEYQYIVGKAEEGKHSDVLTFTIYPLDWTPKVYHITDLQGFGWLEYQVWASAAEEINNKITAECTTSTKLFPVLINTGDMTLNGTRINEWLDYYNAGKSLFTHLEQMNVVGNNDLCNAYSETALGNGDDDGKSSPYYFHVFYCYEIPDDVDTHTDARTSITATWTGQLILNGVYVPSMYYFYFNKYGYLMVNSELTLSGANNYFKQNKGTTAASYIVNPYTGYSYEECSTNTTNTNYIRANKDYYLGHTLNQWLTTLATNCYKEKIIVACHEMPFTVTIKAELLNAEIAVDRSKNSTGSLIGSHLNVFDKDDVWLGDNTYWFSRMLQDLSIKLCIGGHKHTYAVTYPVSDIAPQANINGVNFSKKATVTRSAVTNPSYSDTGLWTYNSTNSTGVVYCMLQATGYKLQSNKELPSDELYYSYIVPVSTWKSNGTSGTPDVSLLYPMYGTYEYADTTINADIFRVVNVTTENIDDSTHVATPKTLSYSTASNKAMYSERLCVVENATGVNTNYWVVESEDSSYCPGITSGVITVTLRVLHSGTTFTGKDADITPANTSYTLQISATNN